MKNQNKKNNKGITLVALIITIIVLLILAVVAIGAITNDGIISKAKQARDQYGAAQDKENSILQGYLDIINKNAGNGNNGNGSTGNENQGNGNTGNENNGDGSTGNENNGNESDEEVYVNDYGAPIEYSVDLNDDGDLTNDWKVFYKDDSNWYIIASDYLLNTKLPDKFVGRMETYNSYGAYWNWDESLFSNVTDGKAVISQEVANKYKLSWLENNSESLGYINIKAVADLLDEEAWTLKFGNEEKGIKAIGAPTLEMWVASWNEKGYTQLYTDSNEIGYFVGTSTTDLTSIYCVNLASDTAGYGDKLYFPHPYGNDDGWSDNNECWAYWLASPSADTYHSDFLMGVLYSGDVGGRSYIDNVLAMRPLVSVPAELIEKTADGFRVVVD